MKKTILFGLLIFLSLMCTKVIAQTNVSGPYFTNTIWSLSGSPYNLTGDVQIPNGVSLTIEPGVQINFNSDYEILIKGTLVANGTNNFPIIFNGNFSGKSMLLFKSTNLSNSQLSHVKFIGPKNAFQLANESEFNEDLIKNFGTLLVSNIVLTNTKVQSKGYQSTANLIIENAIISGTTIKGVYPRSEKIKVKNSTINNSLINSDSYNYGIIIDECIIGNTQLSIGCCGANIEIIKSELTDSYIIDGHGDANGPIIIKDSKINNTPINLPVARLEISESEINYNTSNGLIFGNGKFECSQITGNNIGTAIKITGGGYMWGNFVMTNSTIKNNSIGLEITNSNIVTIDNSNFYDNTTYNIQNKSSKNITAINNWWGTTNTTAINNSIYDYYDNINLGQVDYTNYRLLIKDITNCSSSLNIRNFENSTLFDGASIFPNPNLGIVNIDLKNLKDVTIKVFSVNGQMIYYKENINVLTYQFKLNEPSGLYIIELSSQGQRQYYKLMKM
ncbi:T9SS type A sorting domain-containing protein [Flavobacterium sp. ZT3R18]|uniref:T9SS type A sorting domain-containing protein n=1 Tax=Flavobacterium sp. ZT3R18 TaxID=2594429 RepID=UPI00117AC2A3|nr:T9SS type A sorting domain-containing protein [Flavobacterium sp. ZT3R18]TRX37297.1 T9SS type A sorting domain-containing protein [Flavobacterium sp. ZT3R18]